MKISELPQDIREIAEIRRSEYDNQPSDSDKVSSAFEWKTTPEGHEIWHRVNLGNFQPFREFHAKQKTIMSEYDKEVEKLSILKKADAHYFAVSNSNKLKLPLDIPIDGNI